MTIERGHQSIYFRDPDVIKQLEVLTEKDLRGDVSISAVVSTVIGAALPELTRQIKKGKRDFELTIKFSL